MPHQEIEITEFNYTEKLKTTCFSRTDINASVNCTNLLCNNPNILVEFDVPYFSCKGKENIGRDCKRSFQVKPVG